MGGYGIHILKTKKNKLGLKKENFGILFIS